MKKLWTYNYQKGLSSQLVSEDYYQDEKYLYFCFCYYKAADNHSLIIKLDKETGEAQTIYEIPHIIRSIGAVENGLMYFTNLREEVTCIDLNGNEIWKTKLDDGNPLFKVLIAGEKIYVNSDGTYCLNKKDGSIVWHHNDSKGCDFCFDEKNIYVAPAGSSVYCLDKNSGEALWQCGDDQWFKSITVFDEKTLMLVGNSKQIVFMDINNGDVINSNSGINRLSNDPVIKDGLVFIGDSDNMFADESKSGHMYCFKVGDKYKTKKIFSTEIESGVSSAAFFYNDKMFFGTGKGYLYIADSDNGEIIKKKKTSGTCRCLAFDGDKIFIMSDKGQVECDSLN